MLKAIITIALAGMGVATSCAVAQEPFYKDKRLTVLINTVPGTGVDIEGRLFARYLTKHIEGQPSVIVQNLDGGAGLNAVHYLGEVAPKDGTVLGYFGGVPWQFVTEPEKFRVDLRTYEFVAYQPNATIYFARTDTPPGIREPADIVKVNGLVSGGIGANSVRDLGIRLTLDMLGVPYRHVTGYRTVGARLALQRNEINFSGETTASYRTAIEGLVRAGEVIPLYFSPSWNGEVLSVPKQVEGLPILPFQELYRQIKGTMPSGRLWDVYLAALALTSTMARLDVLPPRAPQGAVAALRAALLRLNHDKAFAAEAVKSIGYVPEYEAGPDTNRLAVATLTVRPEIRAFVADYVRRANQ